MVMPSGKRVNHESSEGESYTESDNICHETSLRTSASCFEACNVWRFYSQGEQEVKR